MEIHEFVNVVTDPTANLKLAKKSFLPLPKFYMCTIRNKESYILDQIIYFPYMNVYVKELLPLKA